jgi:5-(carboxyamino)imidazole ribonucleotide mutase
MSQSKKTMKHEKRPLVSVVSPSPRLLEQVKDAAVALGSFGIKSEARIVAAHRSPRKTIRFVAECHVRGIEVIIATGEGSAHLPGMIASLTTIPVIGVPLRGDISLGGMDSFLSMVQMPRGVPVGTMGINAAYNAGIFACQILALKYPDLQEKLKRYKEMMEEQVESEDARQSKVIN